MLGIESEIVEIPYNCLAVSSDEGWVLIDTGLGLGIAPEVGLLPQSLSIAGIETGDVRLVILTHGHGDHIGGNTDEEGSLTYPNARYAMHKQEWEFWTSEENLKQIGREQSIPFVNQKLGSISDRIDLFEQEKDILPGIRLLPARGHTPGHTLVRISSGEQHLLYISDLIAHPIHLEMPDWYMVFDLDPEKAVATRRRVLAQAVEEQYLTYGFHLPLPALGHVIEAGDAWRWQPAGPDSSIPAQDVDQ